MRASWRVWLCLALTITAAKAQDSQWTSRDYVDFYFRHYNGHVPLPHLRDETQKALFNHLVDPGNITRIENHPLRMTRSFASCASFWPCLAPIAPPIMWR